MAERDAFGNEKDDDPVAGMGWSSGPPTPEAVDPIAPMAGAGLKSPRESALAATSESPAMSAGIPEDPSADVLATVRTVGRVVRLAAVLVVFGVVVSTIVSIGGKVSDGVDEARRAITGFDGTTFPAIPVPEAGAPGSDGSPPAGFGARSLLLEPNFARALTILRREGPRLRSLRVAPDRLDASIVTASGRMKQVQVTWEHRLRRFGEAIPGFSQAGTFAINSVERGAPFRLARSAAGRAQKAASSIDYLVALGTGADGAPGWTIFVKEGGGQYIADAQGNITRKIG